VYFNIKVTKIFFKGTRDDSSNSKNAIFIPGTIWSFKATETVAMVDWLWNPMDV
jgi:hypothetical protein